MSTITRASAKSKRSKPSGLVERVQATLPGHTGRTAKRGNLGGAVRGVLATVGPSNGHTHSHTAPKKSIAGIAAGVGIGAAAVATRRHRAHRGESDETTSRHPTLGRPLQEVIADS
jgi:hypothetical protein